MSAAALSVVAERHRMSAHVAHALQGYGEGPHAIRGSNLNSADADQISARVRFRRLMPRPLLLRRRQQYPDYLDSTPLNGLHF